MAVTTSDLAERYPEFAGVVTANPTYVSAVLADAEELVGDLWGTKRDSAVLLRCAVLLHDSPFGRGTSQENPKVNPYKIEWDRRAAINACGRAERLG